MSKLKEMAIEFIIAWPVGVAVVYLASPLGWWRWLLSSVAVLITVEAIGVVLWARRRRRLAAAVRKNPMASAMVATLTAMAERGATEPKRDAVGPIAKGLEER